MTDVEPDEVMTEHQIRAELGEILDSSRACRPMRLLNGPSFRSARTSCVACCGRLRYPVRRT